MCVSSADCGVRSRGGSKWEVVRFEIVPAWNSPLALCGAISIWWMGTCNPITFHLCFPFLSSSGISSIPTVFCSRWPVCFQVCASSLSILEHFYYVPSSNAPSLTFWACRSPVHWPYWCWQLTLVHLRKFQQLVEMVFGDRISSRNWCIFLLSFKWNHING